MPIPTMKSNEPEFSIDTAELGRIDVLPLTIGRMSEIEKTKAETSASFMNNLIASIGRKNDGTELTDNDVAKLSDTDREVFAKQVLEFNQYLFRERVVEQHERDEGGVVVSFRDGNVKHQKEEDESDSDYLFRLFKIQKAKLKEQNDRMLAPFADMSKAYRQRFSPSFLEAFTRSQSATAQLGKMIDRLRVNIPGVPATAATPSAPDRIEVYQPEVRVPDLTVIRNPIHNTNKKLSDVVDTLDSMEGLALQMAETVKSVSAATSQFLVDFGVATEKADRSSRRAMWIAVAAIVVVVLSTVGQTVYSEWRTQRDQVDTAMTINALSSQIEANTEVQRESMARIGAELNSGNASTMKVFDRLSTALEKLTESLRIRNGAPNSPKSDGKSVPSE